MKKIIFILLVISFQIVICGEKKFPVEKIMGKTFYCYECVEAGVMRLVINSDNTFKYITASIEGVGDEEFEKGTWVKTTPGKWSVSKDRLVLKTEEWMDEYIYSENIETKNSFQLSGKEIGMKMVKTNIKDDYRPKGAVFWGRVASEIVPELDLKKYGKKLNLQDRTLFLAAIKGDVEAMKKAINSGAKVNAEDEQGETPLFYAIAREDLETVKFLIASKADVNKKSKEKYANFPLAIASISENYEIMELLILAGADINIEITSEYNSLPAVFYFIPYMHLFQTDLEKGIAKKIKAQTIVEILTLFKKRGGDLNKKEKDGKSLLRYTKEATEQYPEYKPVVDFLIKSGAKE